MKIKQNNKGILLLILAVLTIFSIWMFILSFATSVDTKHTISRNNECERLGYEKSAMLGFQKYCINESEKVEVEGNCNNGKCNFIIK